MNQMKEPTNYEIVSEYVSAVGFSSVEIKAVLQKYDEYHEYLEHYWNSPEHKKMVEVIKEKYFKLEQEAPLCIIINEARAWKRKQYAEKGRAMLQDQMQKENRARTERILQAQREKKLQTDPVTTGEKIRTARQARNLTQKELAEKLGVTTGTVAVWETSGVIPSIYDIAKLSKILCVTTDSLIAEPVKNEEKNDNHKEYTSQKQHMAENPVLEKIKETLFYIVNLEWAEDIKDFLDDIPFIGPMLGLIYYLFAILLTIAVIIGVIVGVFVLLFNIHPVLALVVGAIGMNVIAFCASYVWGERKKWFFWACLILSIIALIVLPFSM